MFFTEPVYEAMSAMYNGELKPSYLYLKSEVPPLSQFIAAVEAGAADAWARAMGGRNGSNLVKYHIPG